MQAQVLESMKNVEIWDRVTQSVAAGPTVFIDAALATSDTMLAELLVKEWSGNSALVTANSAPPFDHALRVANKRITSSGTEFHRVSDPTHLALGLLRISSTPEVVRELLSARSYVESLNVPFDSVGLLTLVLVRSNIPLMAVESVGISARVGGDAETQIPAVDSQNPKKLLLAKATRANDGFYSTFVLRKFSRLLTQVAIAQRWTPNAITWASMAVTVGAAVLFAQGSHRALMIGAALVQLAIIVDCSDGEVARYTNASSQYGAWLDAATDRVKEYLLYAALAVGAARHGTNLWPIAMVLVVMQTVRHLSDYNFVAIRAMRENADLSLPLTQSVDDISGSGSRLLTTSSRLNSRRLVHWIKRVIYLPIGERWLIISVGAFVGSPSLVFNLLLWLGLFGLAYVTLGRFMRSRRWRHTQDISGCDILERQFDAGPLLSSTLNRGHPLAGRFGWAVPSFLRLIELGLVVLIGYSEPLAFITLFAIAFHHYDTMYRSLEGNVFPAALTKAGLGFEGRMLVLLVLFGQFHAPLHDTLALIGGYLFAVLVIRSSITWAREIRAPRTARAKG